MGLDFSSEFCNMKKNANYVGPVYKNQFYVKIDSKNRAELKITDN